jgi:hypothetical protein
MSSLYRRSAGDIRIAFKILTALPSPGRDSLKAFDLLWDEANGAAAEVINTLTAADYLAS